MYIHNYIHVHGCAVLLCLVCLFDLVCFSFISFAYVFLYTCMCTCGILLHVYICIVHVYVPYCNTCIMFPLKQQYMYIFICRIGCEGSGT